MYNISEVIGVFKMTMPIFTVKLAEIVREFSLEAIYAPANVDSILISTSDLNRPGLQLATGFFDYFDATRIQILGKMEDAFLQSLSPERRLEVLRSICSRNVPAVIVSHGMEIYPELLTCARESETPLYSSELNTSHLMAGLIGVLNVYLAPRITRHGVLVEVHGEGILILGESGVGKSETAIELVKRGHRLVADDAVEIKRTSSKTLVGSAPEIIRHFVEIRGIGIVDVKNIFGVGAVKDAEKIDLVLHLEAWNENKQYDRLGLEDEYTNILGINVRSIIVPVKPGRNLAVIVEVAAMNNRQKKMGYSAAAALNERLVAEMTKGDGGGL